MPLFMLVASLSTGASDAGARDAGIADASSTAGATGGVIDFTDDEGIAGGEELTTAPPEPIEHESLLPDRYRGPRDEAPKPASPEPPRKRGCGGCRVGQGSGAGGWLALVAFGLGVAIAGRRARR